MSEVDRAKAALLSSATVSEPNRENDAAKADHHSRGHAACFHFILAIDMASAHAILEKGKRDVFGTITYSAA